MPKLLLLHVLIQQKEILEQTLVILQKTITAKIDGVQNYLTETIYPAVDTLESSIGDIWGKIEKWPNTIN